MEEFLRPAPALDQEAMKAIAARVKARLAYYVAMNHSAPDSMRHLRRSRLRLVGTIRPVIFGASHLLFGREWIADQFLRQALQCLLKRGGDQEWYISNIRSHVGAFCVATRHWVPIQYSIEMDCVGPPLLIQSKAESYERVEEEALIRCFEIQA